MYVRVCRFEAQLVAAEKTASAAARHHDSSVQTGEKLLEVRMQHAEPCIAMHILTAVESCSWFRCCNILETRVHAMTCVTCFQSDECLCFAGVCAGARSTA